MIPSNMTTPLQAPIAASVSFPPVHPGFTSDSIDANSGVLFVKVDDEYGYWVDDKNIINKFTSTSNAAESYTSFHFVPFSSKQEWWKKYPATPLVADLHTNSNDETGLATPRGTLNTYLFQDEKESFPRAIVMALEYYVMAQVDAEDYEALLGHQKPLYHVGYPCIKCTCCNGKLCYDSPERMKYITTGHHKDSIIGHLLQCPSFEQKATLETYKQRQQSEVTQNSDYSKSLPKVCIRVGRLSGGNCTLYNHEAMIKRAKIVDELAIEKGIKKKGNKNHKSVCEIYQEPEVENLINTMFALRLSKKDYTLRQTEDLFKTVKGPDGNPVDIKLFREDWEAQFKKGKGLQFNLWLCFIYMMRYKQYGCPGCDSIQDDHTFGGNGESNHVAADGAKAGSSEANTKSFGLDYHSAYMAGERIVAEYAETQYECECCHNHFGSTKPYWDLDSICYGKGGEKYKQLLGVCVYSDVQVTAECKKVHAAVDELIASDLSKLPYIDLRKLFEFQRYDLRDITLFREPDWEENQSNRQRIRWVKQIEYYYEKRSIGGCFLCGKSILNGPARDFCSIDSHHVDPKGKDRNPSECVNMNLKEGRLERRKCCPLCRPCHVKVHNVESKGDEFDKKLAKGGYALKSYEVVKC